MAKYIEREALEKAIHTGMNIIEVMQTIIDIPAADVRLVARGRWKIVTGEHHMRWRECSVCGAAHDLAYKWPFCPSCGADMREARS